MRCTNAEKSKCCIPVQMYILTTGEPIVEGLEQKLWFGLRKRMEIGQPAVCITVSCVFEEGRYNDSDMMSHTRGWLMCSLPLPFDVVGDMHLT